MKRNEPKPIGEIIEHYMRIAEMSDEHMRRKAEAAWAKVVGSNIALFTREVRMQESILHVYITSASLKEELLYIRPDLVKHLNAAVGSEIVAEIAIH